ncbi:MAG TPA: hypothetical protein VNR00_03860 [Opitutus sp.]|nr:hypothetical protein [Opitutus sp.]
MATRVSPPMTAGNDKTRYLEPGHWEVGLTFRFYEADRHFYDDNEERVPANAPRVKRAIYDASLTRMLDTRTSLTVSVPFQVGAFDRSPAPPHTGSADKAKGIGDIAVTLRRWMFDPATHPHANVRLGLGLKLPTGKEDAQTDRRVNTAAPGDPPNLVWKRGPADLAIQPGDGGLGIILGAEGFHQIGSTNSLVYGEFTYLLNPRGTNGVNNQWSGAGPYVANSDSSVPDYFLARGGVSVGQPLGAKNTSFQLGFRLEGQPPRDVIGSSAGFRRPGFSLAVEPGLAYSFGATSLFVSVPLTVYRQRWLSVDEKRAGRVNAVSAAFADYNILAGISHRW